MSFIDGPEQGPFFDGLGCLVDEQFSDGTLGDGERTWWFSEGFGCSKSRSVAIVECSGLFARVFLLPTLLFREVVLMSWNLYFHR